MDDNTNTNEIKALVSSVILSFGFSGLLYSLPLYNHPMLNNFLGVNYYIIISVILLITGIASKIIISRAERNKSEQEKRKWTKSLHLSIVSLSLFLSLLIFTNPTPGYAPHTFAYNIGFVIPIFWSAFLLSILGPIFFMSEDKEKRKNTNLVIKLILIGSTIPFLIELLLN